MERTKKHTTTKVQRTKRSPLVDVTNIQVKARFEKADSLCLETYVMFLGKFKACLYFRKDNKWYIQNNLPEFPVHNGPYRTEQDAKNICIKIAHTFFSMVDYEKNA